MKKSNLVSGVLYLLVGLGLLGVAVMTETRLDSILWGMAGALLGPGLAMIVRYVYWSAPERKAQYQERLEKEAIEMRDELKESIRNRAGRCAYLLGLAVTCIAILAFSLLGMLEILSDTKVIVLYLSGYLLFQYAAGVVIFNRILKKY